MAVGRDLLIDRAAQVERLDDGGRTEVEALAYQLAEMPVAELAGAEGIDQHGDRLRHADGVGQLQLALGGEAGCDDVLGDVARHIGRAAVNLGRVLAGEGAAAVGRVAAVGIDDDLAAGQAGVADGAADDKAAGRVDEEARVRIEQAGGQIRLDDLFDHGLAQIGDGNVGGMLRGDDDGVDALDGAILCVLDGDLALAVRTEPRQLAVLTFGSQRAGQVVRVGDGGGHQLLRFVAGKAEHHALIASTGLGRVVVGGVHAHGDIGGLLVDGGQDRAAAAVEAAFGVVIADAGDGIARNARDVHIAARGDFAHDQNEAGRGRAFTGDARLRVLRQNGVQNAVGDLVADLVGMSFGHGFRGENSLVFVHNTLLPERSALPFAGK
ncbi:putative uncharacterized protein PY07799 [Firmicutes bacterium CAG:170]|nr:putative uncharacterized protein PY07799 [Firmicutes bacterium CAG:170]